MTLTGTPIAVSLAAGHDETNPWRLALDTWRTRRQAGRYAVAAHLEEPRRLRGRTVRKTDGRR